MAIVYALIRRLVLRIITANVGGLIGIIIGAIAGVLGIILCLVFTIGSFGKDPEFFNGILLVIFWVFLSLIGIPLLGMIGAIIGTIVKLIIRGVKYIVKK
jgi:hypothetical protein